MHVFVTGATGFVGFHTVMALHKAGHSIRFGVRNAEKMKRLYAPYGIDTSDFAIGEITDAEAIQQGLQGCDAVVHTAAVVSMDPNKAEHMMHTNLSWANCFSYPFTLIRLIIFCFSIPIAFTVIGLWIIIVRSGVCHLYTI